MNKTTHSRRLAQWTFFAVTAGGMILCPAAEPPTWRVSATREAGSLPTLEAALEASRREPGEDRRIVLGPGLHYAEKTVTLDQRDAGLTIEGAGAGKTILHGGRRISGWRQDGEHFQVADVPEVKEGKWDFRALVVNDRLCPRARLPEEGRFDHDTRFPVRWMSSAGGGWERKPTEKELTTLQYREGDLGDWLSVRNAEVTVYHMWDESMVGLAAHDPKSRTLTFSTPAKSPPGAFGVNTFAVWNVREGMKQPGQWYLDRDAGRIVYWPLPGEDMSKAVAVAPTVETILDLNGQQGKPVRHVTLRSFTLSTTTTPCEAGGFGASLYRGALDFRWGEGVRVTNLEVTNIAGNAIRAWNVKDLTVADCRMTQLGAGGLRAGAGSGRIENNHLHHIGLIYPSAIGMAVSGPFTIRRNEIHHTPYSGMSIGGEGIVVEENLLHHCMEELHDGAAIYGSPTKGVIRRNVVRDIIAKGTGYGVSSYYLDEKARDCIVEKNVSIGVKRPAHNHMTLNCTLRDNVFLCDGDMDLSFARSAGFRVTGNTFQLNGKLKVNDSDAIAEWKDNLIVQSGDETPAIGDAMPAEPREPRNKPLYAKAGPMPAVPVLDGKLGGDEWPPGGTGMNELPDQRRSRGAPLMAKFCADQDNLYVAVSVVSMYPEERKLGRAWGTDEGVELALGGFRPDGKPVTYVLRGFAGGKPESLTLAGATEAEAKALAEAIGYGSSVGKQIWSTEWAIPFQALRFAPRDGATLPLNVTVYRSENQAFIQWAGARGDTWDLERGGRLNFSGK